MNDSLNIIQRASDSTSKGVVQRLKTEGEYENVDVGKKKKKKKKKKFEWMSERINSKN
jgi:hypothetical protein